MNKFLEKIAESLPYRQRAEILIHKGDKVLVTFNSDKDGDTWHGLPGGGVEEGQTPEQGAIQEALEEVGIGVKNVKHSGITSVKHGYAARTSKAHRSQVYGGSVTHLIEADYDKLDKSLLGSEGDQTKYKWLSIEEANRLLVANHERGNSGDHQIRALKKYL